MPIYNLIKYIDNYSKIPGTLWQCCRDEPVLDGKGDIVDFTNNTTDSVNLNEKKPGQTGSGGTKKLK